MACAIPYSRSKPTKLLSYDLHWSLLVINKEPQRDVSIRKKGRCTLGIAGTVPLQGVLKSKGVSLSAALGAPTRLRAIRLVLGKHTKSNSTSYAYVSDLKTSTTAVGHIPRPYT